MRKYLDILNEALDEDMIDTNAAPPENDVKDAQHYAAARKTGFFGEQAAGCVLMAKTTGRMLIVLRSGQVMEPYTWGNCGGAFDAKEERPVEAARREAHEETGYTGAVKMIPLLVFKKDTFRYSNFLAVVEDEFEPHLGWEADQAKWVEIGAWPQPLHFGLKALFADAVSMKTITHYAEMFRSGNRAVEAVEAVDENITLPAGVDVAKAIGDASDAVKQLAADAELDPNGESIPGQPLKPGQQPAKPGAPVVPGQPAKPGTPAPAAAPAAKKSLSPIRPQ